MLHVAPINLFADKADRTKAQSTLSAARLLNSVFEQPKHPHLPVHILWGCIEQPRLPAELSIVVNGGTNHIGVSISSSEPKAQQWLAVNALFHHGITGIDLSDWQTALAGKQLNLTICSNWEAALRFATTKNLVAVQALGNISQAVFHQLCDVLESPETICQAAPHVYTGKQPMFCFYVEV
ncbi:hypothetical protein [Salinibius halmophilus]|uniref:hypothetical protein n=1 Tax=Salinibius halmophilus TaxID=1853216 RepID=UPI000E66F933|nr:hypothetical protein [Salinibius halmophilus]